MSKLFLIRVCRPIAVGFIVLFLCSSARANYYNEIVSTTVPLTSTDFTESLALKSFNTSLGTLANIVISYSDNGSMQGLLQNTSNSSQKFTVSEDSNIKLSYGSSVLLTNDLVASQSYTNIGSMQTAQFGVFNPTGQAASKPITSGPLFNAFLEPSSNVMMTFGTLTSTTVVGGGGNISTGIYTSVGSTVTVTFEYTPFVSVPEPASFVMTAVGILIFGASRYRSRRSDRHAQN